MIRHPAALEPLAANRRELSAILDLLDHETDPTIRADLASELVGSCSKYEDVVSRVVYPSLRLATLDQSQIDSAEAAQESIRSDLTDIRNRTKNVKPSDVHYSDPEGFERVLERLVASIRDHFDHEDRYLFPALQTLEDPALKELRDAVQQGVDHASTHPNPPNNPVARAVVAVVEKLNRNVHDRSTVSHPEIEHIHEDLKTAGETDR